MSFNSEHFISRHVLDHGMQILDGLDSNFNLSPSNEDSLLVPDLTQPEGALIHGISGLESLLRKDFRRLILLNFDLTVAVTSSEKSEVF